MDSHSQENADAGYTIKQMCGVFIPVAYSYPGLMISLPCGLNEGHERPHRTEIRTDEWHVVIEGSKHERG